MLSNKVRELRKKAGWSQQKLAERAGLSFNVITKIEQGLSKSPSIHTIIKLSNALGITLDELVGRIK